MTVRPVVAEPGTSLPEAAAVDQDDAPVDEVTGATETFSDEELTWLALTADPDTPLDAGAVPWSLYVGQMATVLPQWYMPPATVGHTTRWRTVLVLAIVLALVMIDAWGLCSTYGNVVPA